MHEEIIASTELFDSFPHYTMSDYTKRYSNGSIPSSVIPQSKYSSTETEFSSDEYDDSGGHHNPDSGGKITSVSGTLTSTSSSESARKRRRRKRNGISSSCGSSGDAKGGGRLTSSLNLSIRSGESSRMSLRSYISKGGDRDSMTNSPIPVLNSINDLRHAIGRHRGISGSFTPAIDSTLFAMFFATDIFDGILKDEMKLNFNSRKYDRASISNSVRRDVISVLRKEIVYSLRTSYFCPASKIVKLAHLLEDNFPLEQFHEPAHFLDLLLSKVLNVYHPPFQAYSNGSSSYVHRLSLKRIKPLVNSYFQPSSLTVQQLLQQKLLGDNVRFGKYYDSFVEGDGGQFEAVPYPALVMEILREDSPRHSTSNQLGRRHNPNFPIIPNMEIDLTSLISYNKSTGNLRKTTPHDDRFLQSYQSNISYYPSSSSSVANSFSSETDVGSHLDASESRLVKGLKSAWKVMFTYLEHFTTSSSDFTAHHHESSSSFTTANEPSNRSFTETYSTTTKRNKKYYNDVYSSHGQINHLSASSTSLLLSSASLPLYSPPLALYDNHHAKNELHESFGFSGETFPQLQQQQHKIKMELIAVICYAGGRNEKDAKIKDVNNGGGKRSSSLPSYVVYCKAGSDYNKGLENTGANNGNFHRDENYAPWFLYQSRYGVAPQVTLIENFGKWIYSLERNHDDLNMYKIPLEIRRVLENSHLLIYKRAL